MDRHFAAFVRLSENLAWRSGTLAAVFLFFSAVGYMLRNGTSSPESLTMTLLLVVALQLGALARACYFYHLNIPFDDTPAANYTDEEKGATRGSISSSLFLAFDACISHPILGTVQPLLCLLLAAGTVVEGASRLVAGAGWEHLVGLGMIAAGWLGIVLCWSAFLHRIGIRSHEAWQLVQEQVRRLRR